jgi:hypothetical protein
LDQLLHRVRRRQRALARGVLALFCLAWLQAAVVPCAMADTASATMPAGAQHCPYCPEDGSTLPVVDHVGACAFPHQPQVDGRTSALFVAIPPASFTPVVDVFGGAGRVPAPAIPEPVPRVPIALCYCRFLE